MKLNNYGKSGFKFSILAKKAKIVLSQLPHFLQFSLKDLLIGISAVIIALVAIGAATYYYFAKDLGTAEMIMNRNNTGVILTDTNGKVFYKFYNAQYRNPIPLNQIPKFMQEAVIIAEDRNFYNHPGFSIRGMVGALIADIRKQSLDYGGSTITQQLVKNSLLNANKSFLRKYQEIILAQEIERRYSKNQILEMYLNSVYFGQGSFGIEEAAKTYFNKDAKDLNLAESAYLAGLINAPSQLSPYSGGLDAGIARQHYVLDQMTEKNQISPTEAKIAKNTPLDFNQNPNPFDYQAPQFALMVKDALIAKYGEERIARSGFVVKTSLNLDWQNYAQKVVAQQVDNLKPDRVSNGAAVVIDPLTGEVRALVGSKDWNNPKFGKVNIATSLRQPGSSFKPIMYSTAFEERLLTPSTILEDVPTTYKPTPGLTGSLYSPHDYDYKYRGPVTVRRALSNSLNIPAVEVMSKVGVPATLDMAKRLGISTLGDPSEYGLSLALGAGEVKLLELTNVYAIFADQGNKNPITLIEQIKDKNGKIIYNYTPQPQQVLDPGVAFLISSILSDNATRAEEFGTLLNADVPAAVKTGTTENFRDSWTMGYTPHVAVGVWVGNNDGTLMDQVAGSIGAAPIWKALINKFSQNFPVSQFVKPDDVVSEMVCRSNGLLATNTVQEASTSAVNQTQVATNSGIYKEYFLEGTQPKASCSSGHEQILHIDGKDIKINLPDNVQGISVSPPTINPNQTFPGPVNNGQFQQGGWYPIGPNGQSLQYWDGQWYDSPQQDRHKD